MEDLTPSTTTEQTFLKNFLLWPLWRDLIMKQEWHCVHYFVGFFWLTLFRHTPISCILFVPGPTSSTWKHPVQCTYTTLCVCVYVCVLHILRELFLLSWCVNKLSIVWCETCCRAHDRPGSDFPVPRNKCSFILQAVAAPPRIFLEWHHTVTAVSASTHLPVILKLFMGRSTSTHYEDTFACKKKNCAWVKTRRSV